MHEFLNDQNCNIKSLLFQIIHTLISIQYKYPGFRHNKLNIDNIMLYLKKANQSFTKYFVGKQTYFIPNLGFDVKIFNFIHSSIEEFIFNSDIPKDQNKKNRYYDIKTFLIDLLNYIDLEKCSNEIKVFLYRAVRTRGSWPLVESICWWLV